MDWLMKKLLKLHWEKEKLSLNFGKGQELHLIIYEYKGVDHFSTFLVFEEDKLADKWQFGLK